MYIERLVIDSNKGIIRTLEFKKGMNLIIDDTPSDDKKKTGNNVGKTTTLKLIYYCLGGEEGGIYKDEENKKEKYVEVEEYLKSNNVRIKLTLIEDIGDSKSKRIEIERGFYEKREKAKINGREIDKQDFVQELSREVFPTIQLEKPTFKQIISHNIRYKEGSISKTLKTLDQYTTDVVYEHLYLFLLGCLSIDAKKREDLIIKIKQLKAEKGRLEYRWDKKSYEIALEAAEEEIKELHKKEKLVLDDEQLKEILDQINQIQSNISKRSEILNGYQIRLSLINESVEHLKKNVSKVNIREMRELYAICKNNLGEVHKTFEELVDYHNAMIQEKIRFISEELPELIDKCNREESEIEELAKQKLKLSQKIKSNVTVQGLNELLRKLESKYYDKGRFKEAIKLITNIETEIIDAQAQLEKIDSVLYSDEKEKEVLKQVEKFNKYFATISNSLYGNRFALKCNKIYKSKEDRNMYDFSSFNLNMSSGQKQGEIICFDLAYSKFADEEKIPCLHFLLNDKKELMHDNQLTNIAEYVNKNDVQLVISILKDKTPTELLKNSNVVVELSQEDKLFRIESNINK